MSQNEMCVMCNEAITNPICPNCVERHVLVWAFEEDPLLFERLQDVGESVKGFDLDGVQCIICKDQLNVCPHCFSNEVYDWLKENSDSNTVKRFHKHFNFELGAP